MRTVLADRPAYGEIVKLIDQCTHNLAFIEYLPVAVATLNTLLKIGPGGPDAPMEDPMWQLTGDRLAISALMWSAALQAISLMIPELRRHDWKWAVAYGFASVVFIALGLFWPIAIDFIRHPPSLNLEIIFQNGAVVLGMVYAVMMKAKTSKFISTETASFLSKE